MRLFKRPKRKDAVQLNTALNTNWGGGGSVGSPRRLLKYGQLPDKNSRNISRDMWNVSRYFKMFIH
jgi:hypothetical protein